MTGNSLVEFLNSGCLLVEENMGKMHYVFQLSHLNPVYAANTGHWKIIHCAVSDCKPTQHPVFDREQPSDI